MESTLLAFTLLHWFAQTTLFANTRILRGLATGKSRVSACFCAVGITVAAGAWAIPVLLSTSIVLVTYPVIWFGTKACACAYLIYVGVHIWQSDTYAVVDYGEGASLSDPFLLGFLTNLLNLRSALLSASLLSAVLPTQPTVFFVSAAITIVIFNTLFWHLLLALALSYENVRMHFAHQRLVLSRTAGLLITAFGLRSLILIRT